MGASSGLMTSAMAQVMRPIFAYFFCFVATVLRVVAALDGMGVQISTEAGTRFLPAAKSASSAADCSASTSLKINPLRGQKSPPRSTALARNRVRQVGHEPIMFGLGRSPIAVLEIGADRPFVGLQVALVAPDEGIVPVVVMAARRQHHQLATERLDLKCRLVRDRRALTLRQNGLGGQRWSAKQQHSQVDAWNTPFLAVPLAG